MIDPRLIFIFLLSISLSSAQEGELEVIPVDTIVQSSSRERVSIDAKAVKKEVNPLAPSRAAFYSAILPGLGQVYNKRYWKVPIVWAAIGTGIYVYTYNNDEYNRFRSAFKRRRAGFTDDEFYDINNSGVVPGSPDFSDQALQDAQERFQRDRDLTLLITIGLYALNIIDANVDAHLKQFNVDEDLSLQFRPYLEFNAIAGSPNYGIRLVVTY